MHDFLRFPRQVYDARLPWIPPLEREIRRKLHPADNAFFNYGDVTTFVAYDESGRPVGRIAAIINPWHEKMHGERTGFFGFFECIDDVATASELFRSVAEVLMRAGCDRILGPVNLTTNDESGFLLEGYDEPPTFMCNYCPPYYHELMAACGFHKAIDTLSYLARHGHPFPEKYYRVLERLKKESGIMIRRFSKKTAKADILTIANIYNRSFRETWGFVPISQEEAVQFGQSLLPIADLDLIWIASYRGEPAGAILGFPNINEILAKLSGRLSPLGIMKLMLDRKKIKGMRVAAFGVVPEFRNRGIETILINKVHERVHSRPYETAEFSVVLENNLPMRNLLEQFGFTQNRRFRIYMKELRQDR
jgi:ribosomal protein S18 acetylase RimI-like enzyme